MDSLETGVSKLGAGATFPTPSLFDRRTILFALAGSSALAPVAAQAQAGFQPLAEIPPDHGVVYVYRPPRTYGSGNALRVAVDGVFSGRLRNGRYMALILTPGIHVISISPYQNPLLLTPDSTPTDINVDAGGSHYVRAAWSMTGGIYSSEVVFQGVDEAVALPEITPLRPSE
jgi:hypothetical protein